MIKLYDRVVLTTDVDRKFKSGDIGTVVMIHGKNEGYEVEFFSLDGTTVGVETLRSSQIRPVSSDELAHVRKIA